MRNGQNMPAERQPRRRVGSVRWNRKRVHRQSDLQGFDLRGLKANPMKVFLVEDSLLLRERLIYTLSSIQGITIAGYADTAGVAVEQIREHKPDVVILDIRLRQGTGLEVLQATKSSGQGPCMIVLTNFAYPQYRKKYMESGADYFFDKSNEFDQVVPILKELLNQPPQKSLTA
jgi:DNA-binding NarL/FixJ family response regulator